MNLQNTHGYPSTRLPLFARNIVSTSHPLAAQAGLRMLLQGGNAVDAAIAAAAALTITEPVSNGLGSDAFCILWDGQQLHGLNASGTAPTAWTPGYFHRKHGSDALTPPKRGIDSVTVPGAVAGWAALSERFGKLPFADLMQPAIELAERGYAVPVVVRQKWAAATPELQSQPGFAEHFLPWGRAPQVGELFKFPAAARGLRAIAESRGEAFYRGPIAQALARFSAQHGGALTEADLAAFHPEWVAPIGQDYRGHTLHEIPPNGQGIAALIALGILSNFDLAATKVDSVAAQHLQIEAMKLAFADVYRYVAESGAMDVSSEQMLDPAYLRERDRDQGHDEVNRGNARVHRDGVDGGSHNAFGPCCLLLHRGQGDDPRDKDHGPQHNVGAEFVNQKQGHASNEVLTPAREEKEVQEGNGLPLSCCCLKRHSGDEPQTHERDHASIGDSKGDQAGYKEVELQFNK